MKYSFDSLKEMYFCITRTSIIPTENSQTTVKLAAGYFVFYDKIQTIGAFDSFYIYYSLFLTNYLSDKNTTLKNC